MCQVLRSIRILRVLRPLRMIKRLPALRKIVNDINIKRRAVYSDRAKANNATLEEYALTAGCQAILATKPGEKYQAPNGSWETRGAGAPQRDPRCP